MVRGHNVKSARKSGSVPTKASSSPAATKSTKSNSAKRKNNTEQLPVCTGCDVAISDDTRALMCDKCQSSAAWKCCLCLNLPAEVYDVLVSANCSSLVYLCDDCEGSLHGTDTLADDDTKLQPVLQEMSTSLTYLVTNDKQDDVKQLLEKLLGKVENIEKVIQAKADAEPVMQLQKWMHSLDEKLMLHDKVMQKLEEEVSQRVILDRKVDDIASVLSDKQNEWKASAASEVVAESVQNKLREDEIEKEDQMKRRNSVVLFGVAESESVDAEVRVADDVEKLQLILKELELPDDSEIAKVIRLGKKPDTSVQKPRPLKVTFQSEETKTKLLSKAKNLRDKKEGDLDKVFIYPDLTPKQRETRKQLVAELKNRQSNGESGLIIVGTKIVKRREY